MKYNISSKKFKHPLLKPILEKLTAYFFDKGIHFYVIGATARDIVMELHNEKSVRKTHDLDIAVAISDWQQYEIIEQEIISIEGITKDKKNKQRFFYKEDFQLDIVPFGEVMKQDDKIFWPPDEEKAMSVLGFSEVSAATLKVEVDHQIEIQVAGLEGVFLLKLTAWTERYNEGNKDADDMAFIINNYYSIKEDDVHEKHFDLIEDEDFDIRTAGARLLGRDMKELLGTSKGTEKKIIEILQSEINKKESSLLINQMLETHSGFNYELVLKCLNNIVTGLNE